MQHMDIDLKRLYSDDTVVVVRNGRDSGIMGCGVIVLGRWALDWNEGYVRFQELTVGAVA
jgi:hypothetical protein